MKNHRWPFFLSLRVSVDWQFLPLHFRSISLPLSLKIEILILIRACRAQQLALKVLDKRQQTCLKHLHLQLERWAAWVRRSRKGGKVGREEEWWFPVAWPLLRNMSSSPSPLAAINTSEKKSSWRASHTQTSILTSCIQQFNCQGVWISTKWSFMVFLVGI